MACSLHNHACGCDLRLCLLQMHSLPLLYASGLVWGLSNGVAYMPPIAALLHWFPERKVAVNNATEGCED